MKNELANMMVFKGHEVEVFEWNGKVLFNSKHVAECLEIVEVRSSIRDFNEKQVIRLKNSDVHDMHIRKLNNAGENFLTESGVYKLIFKSHKPDAEKFQDWVTDEVLPTIRKHGMYATKDIVEEMLNNPDTMILTLQELKREREEKEKYKQLAEDFKHENCKLKPDAEMARDLLKQDVKTFTLKEVADLLENGRTELCTLLRLGQVLSKQTGYNLPYNKYIKQGYFKIKIKGVNSVTVVTPKGLKFIYRLIKKFNLLSEFDTNYLLQLADTLAEVA